MTDFEAHAIVLLTEIRDELQKWNAPVASSTECPHPEDDLMDLSDMRETHMRCRRCKQEWKKERT